MYIKAFVATVMVILALQSAFVSGQTTVAHWRFEEGPADHPVRHVGVDGDFFSAVMDVSGNGNHLSPWSQQPNTGMAYSSDVPHSMTPLTGQSTHFSLSPTGNYPGLFTSSHDSNPAGVDLQSWRPSQWTIEAWIKPSGSGMRTIVGRDGSNVSGNSALSPLNFGLQNDNRLYASFVAVDGNHHSVSSFVQLIPEQWYHVAVVSSGSWLRVYIDGVLSGSENLSGSSALTRQNVDRGWSVGRGMHNNNHTYRWQGLIDQIRISEGVLNSSQFLSASGQPYSHPWAPNPKNGDFRVGLISADRTIDLDLSWKVALDPQDPDQSDPDILAHYIYISRDRNEYPNDTDLYYVGQLDDISVSGGPEILLADHGRQVQVTIQGLNLEGQYYWQIEQAHDDGTGQPNTPGNPDNTAGPLWAFRTNSTVPEWPRYTDFQQQIKPWQINVRASTSTNQRRPNNTVNQSGFEFYMHNNHSSGYDMWRTAVGGTGANNPAGTHGNAWIEYQFIRPFNLGQLWIWNYNQQGFTQYGLQRVRIQYSLDRQNWHTLYDQGRPLHILNRASGMDDLSVTDIIDFGGVEARFVLITAVGSLGNYGGNLYGLSEVRFGIDGSSISGICAGDMTGDCRITALDLAEFGQSWLLEGIDGDSDRVDFSDYADLAGNWLQDYRAEGVMSYLQAMWDERNGLYYGTYQNYSGWHHMAWAQGIHFPAIIEAAKHDETYLQILEEYFDATHERQWNPVWGGYEPLVYHGGSGTDIYYDDNAWFAMAFCYAYDLTGDQKWLDRAKVVFDLLIRGWDTECLGGRCGSVFWHVHMQDKGTVTNATSAYSGFLIADRVQNPSEKQFYLDWARQMMYWPHEHLQAPDGRYWDSFNMDGHMWDAKFTYNSGMMIRNFLYNYKFTEDPQDLEEALHTGWGSHAWTDYETGAYDPDGAWFFSYLLVEAALELYDVTGNPYFLERAQDTGAMYWDDFLVRRIFLPDNDTMQVAGAARVLWLLKSYPDYDPRPISFWSFDQAGGSEAVDSRSNLHGQISDAQRVAGRDGSALHFDGRDSIVLVPDLPPFDPVNAITVSAWIKADTWRHRIRDGAVVSKEQQHGATERGYALRVGENGKLAFAVAVNDVMQEVVSPQIMELDQWHHIVGVYDRHTLRVFIDGQLVGSQPAPGTMDQSDQPLSIGKSYFFNRRSFNGTIDEVAFWSRALTAAEIAELYDNQTADGFGEQL